MIPNDSLLKCAYISSMDNYVDLVMIAAKTGLSMPTLRRYIKQLKDQDPKGYDSLTISERGQKGKPKILYHEEDFIAFVLAYKEQKENVRVANLKKGKYDVGQQVNPKAIQANVLIKKTKGGKTAIVAKETRVNFLDMDNPQEVMAMIRSVCNLYTTGAYSLPMSCKEMGIGVSHFWKLVAVNDETMEFWESCHKKVVAEHVAEYEYWMNSRALEILKTKELVTTVTDYEYRVFQKEDGSVERVAIPMSKKTTAKQYIPSSNDLLFASKMLLEIKLNSQYAKDASELEYSSDMGIDELQAEIAKIEETLSNKNDESL